MDALQPIFDFVGTERGFALLRAAAFLVLGWVLARAATGLLTRLFKNILDTQRLFLVRRSAFYAIILLALFSALLELGFNLGVLLGAAGILTVAVGFAAQTSASNIISGLFLIGEAPFSIGDLIKVGELTGEVLSIDLLSVKLRTLDNLFVRVPNESLIKSNVTNLTRFPIRRFDLQLWLDYKEDLVQVGRILEAVADECKFCLDEPKPQVIFQGFGESGQNVQFSVWAARANWLTMRNALPAKVLQALAQENIEIGLPQRRYSQVAPPSEQTRN